MKACLNQDTLRTTDTHSFIRIAKKCHYDAVEFTMDKIESILETGTIQETKKLIQDQGLKIASINGPENFNMLNKENFVEMLERTDKILRVLRELDCHLLVPVPSTKPNDMSTDEVERRTVEALRKLADYCGNGTNLGLEFLGMRECSVNNLSAALGIIEKVDKGNVGLVLDSFHMHISNSKFSVISRLEIEKLFLVHVNDSEEGDKSKLTDANRLFPGDGVIDLAGLLNTLKEAGYDGFLSLELLRPSYWQRDPNEIAMKGRESLRRVFCV